MSGNDKYILDAILLQDGLLKATLSIDKRNCGYLGCISGWFGALRGFLGSQMVDLGCQVTDWEGEADTDILDAIILRDGLILATLSIDKGYCGYLWCISG